MQRQITFRTGRIGRRFAILCLVAGLFALVSCNTTGSGKHSRKGAVQDSASVLGTTTSTAAVLASDPIKLQVLYITEEKVRGLVQTAGSAAGKKLSLQFQIINLSPVRFSLVCFPFSSPDYETSRKIVLDTLPVSALSLDLARSDIMSTQKLSNLKFAPFRAMLLNSTPNEVVLFVPNRITAGYLYYDILVRPSLVSFQQEVAGKSLPMEFVNALATNPSPPAKDDPNSDD